VSQNEEINKIHFKRYYDYLKSKDTFMASGPKDMKKSLTFWKSSLFLLLTILVEGNQEE